jgi:hypothetical protein
MKKSLLINIFLTICFIFSVNNSFAQIQDNAIDDVGDIAFVAYSSTTISNIAGFAFVLLDNCPNNTTIGFTDDEWLGTSFDLLEGAATWTNNTGATIAKGTVIKIASAPSTNFNGNTITTNLGAFSHTSGFNMGTTDQLFAMTGDRTSPGTFLAFIGSITSTAGLTNNFINAASSLGSGTGVSIMLSSKSKGLTTTTRYKGSTVCSGTVIACNTSINTGTWTDYTSSSITTIAAFFADIPNSFSGSVLPIELTTFEGKNNNNQNLLTWATVSETQNKGFDIERSTDGSRFEKIGFVAGNGTTSQTQRYTFNDDKSPNGIAYYRLKQLDNDGRFEYSKIVAIAQKGDNAVSVFPNPSNGVFTLSGLENIEDEQISIVNSIGQNIAITVQNDGQMDLSAYPSGVYYLRIASSGQVVKVIHQ